MSWGFKFVGTAEEIKQRVSQWSEQTYIPQPVKDFVNSLANKFDPSDPKKYVLMIDSGGHAEYTTRKDGEYIVDSSNIRHISGNIVFSVLEHLPPVPE